MKVKSKAGKIAIAVLVLTTSAVSSGSTAQRLLYTFTYSANQNTTARDSANPAEDYGNNGAFAQGNGASSYSGSLSDKGTMILQFSACRTMAAWS